MQKPEKYNDFCELCNEEFVMIINDRERGDIDDYWEKVTLKYEREWYHGNGRWIEYAICPKCFMSKILPKLVEIGLPKKEFDGYIS